MTLQETEQGRMNLWDKALHSALALGKDIHEAINWAETAVTAFESRFHPEKNANVDVNASN